MDYQKVELHRGHQTSKSADQLKDRAYGLRFSIFGCKGTTDEMGLLFPNDPCTLSKLTRTSRAFAFVEVLQAFYVIQNFLLQFPGGSAPCEVPVWDFREQYNNHVEIQNHRRENARNSDNITPQVAALRPEATTSRIAGTFIIGTLGTWNPEL